MTDKRALSPGNDIAAEYALGVLTGADLESAQTLIRADPQFRAEVARWSGRLAPMLDEIETAPPPASAWTAIERKVGAPSQGGNVVQLHRRISLWRGIAAGASALAACLAIVLLAGLPSPQPAPVQVQQPLQEPLVALVSGPQQTTKLVASWDPGARQLVLAVPGDLRAGAGHSHELWVIPVGGKPSPLGILPTAKQTHLRPSDAIANLLQQGATIAISVEPAGGSPTGQPTGPVIASGALKQA